MKKIAKLLSGLALCCAINCVFAAGLTPEVFIQADIAARTTTLTGMQNRLNLLKEGKGVADEMAAAAASEAAVTQAFASYGTTANQHAAYAAQHDAEITDWLAQHPEAQSALQDLQNQFSTLSQEFDAIRRSQQ